MVALKYPNADTLEQWSVDELQTLGAPATQSNINALMAWGDTEGGWFDNPDTFNPLDTSRNSSATGQPLGGIPTNSDGILAYPNLTAGLEGTAATIEQPNMAGVLASLMGGNGSQTLQAGINSSAWGGVGQPQDQIDSIIQSGHIINPSTSGVTQYVNGSTASSTGSNAETSSSSGQNTPPASTTLFSTPIGNVSIPGGLPTRIALAVIGIVLLLMGLHQLFNSSNDAVNTVVAPIKQAATKVKSGAAVGAEAAA